MAGRVDQEVALVVKQPTSSLARVDQDLALVLRQPTSSLARVDQEVLLVVNSRYRKIDPHILRAIPRRNNASPYRLSPDPSRLKANHTYNRTSLGFWPLPPRPNQAIVTLPFLSVSAAGVLQYSGTAAVTLAALTVLGSAQSTSVGTAAVTLSAVTAAASGILKYSGTAASTLAMLSASATGTSGEGGPLAVTLRAIRASASGTFNLTAIGAITLPRLRTSAHGFLSYSGTAAVTLKQVTLLGGPGGDPAAVTLPSLSVSGSGGTFATANVRHDLYWKYATEDGLAAAWVKQYTGSRQIQIKRNVAAFGTSEQEFDVAIVQGTTVSLTLYATQDVTVKLNNSASPAQTISLTAHEALVWTSDSGDVFPFAVEVTKLFVSNTTASLARFTVSVLILDDSN